MSFIFRFPQLHALPFLLVLLASCAGRPPFTWYHSLPDGGEAPGTAVINPGDKILVQVNNHPELSGEFVVGESGEYSHPVAGLIRVGGSSTVKAARVVEVKLARFIQEPSVLITMLVHKPIVVMVMGEVESTGTYTIPHGAGVLAALSSAGGLGDFASEEDIYVLRTTPTSQRIRFRYADLTKPDPRAAKFALRDGDIVLVE
jgi:polysaccharide export outer membrane protein